MADFILRSEGFVRTASIDRTAVIQALFPEVVVNIDYDVHGTAIFRFSNNPEISDALDTFDSPSRIMVEGKTLLRARAGLFRRLKGRKS